MVELELEYAFWLFPHLSLCSPLCLASTNHGESTDNSKIVAAAGGGVYFADCFDVEVRLDLPWEEGRRRGQAI